jgi:transposase InsO family protein
MIEIIRTVARSLVSAAKARRNLALENLALRHQIAVLQRQSKRPSLKNCDRLLWVGLRRVWPGWKSALCIVQPATVVKWHRAGFKQHWRFKSRPKGGRPKIDPEVRKLIRDMWNANPTWGRPRIQAELAKVGITVGDSTVARYKPKRRKPPSQSWSTFLDNHAPEIVALDFFTVPTATFRVLYVLLIRSHDRRRIIHVNVTDSPTSAWAARQLLEAFPFDTAPRFLIRDNDSIFSAEFSDRVESLGIDEVRTAIRSPWQNSYCERLIGSIRRECLDHVIVLDEQHLRRVLRSYVDYYHSSRTHQSLGNDCPTPRTIQPSEMGKVIAFPEVGGLHHCYCRRMAA